VGKASGRNPRCTGIRRILGMIARGIKRERIDKRKP